MCFHHTIGIVALLNFLRTDSKLKNIQIFRAVIVEKMEHESEERLDVTLHASSQNSLTGGSSSECQAVARDDVSPEVAASSSRNILSGSTSSPRISEQPQVLPDKEF